MVLELLEISIASGFKVPPVAKIYIARVLSRWNRKRGASGRLSAELTGQQVIILKEGTSRSRGRDAQKANIIAAKVIAESIKSSLGPKGMDKMLVDGFGDVTITNDGATILEEMEVQHPAAKMMVEVAKTQDDEVGDGTTTSVVVAGELLKRAEDLLDQDLHPTVIVDGYRIASAKALEILDEIAIKVDPTDKAMLKRIAIVSLASKLLAEYEQIAELAVNAVLQVAEKTEEGGYRVDIDDIKMEKKPGESLLDTVLIKGIVLDKEVVHPGMPKRIADAKIALVDSPLEVEKTEFDAKINIENPEQMKSFLDEEEKMLKDMVEKVAAAGANVLLCEKGIDDVAQHYLAKKGILAVRRVKQSDIEKLVDDAERAIHDALCVVRDVVRDPRIVGGGGAPEAEIAKQLRAFAQKQEGKEQLAVLAFANGLEAVPVALAENAGLDPIDIMVQLRAAHEKGQTWYGVDVFEGKAADLKEKGVLEPHGVKMQVIKSASEAAGMILKIDDVIASSRSKDSPGPPKHDGEGGEEGASEY